MCTRDGDRKKLIHLIKTRNIQFTPKSDYREACGNGKNGSTSAPNNFMINIINLNTGARPLKEGPPLTINGMKYQYIIYAILSVLRGKCKEPKHATYEILQLCSYNISW